MRAICAALLAMWVGVSASNLKASPIAFDTAGDSAYNNFNPNSTTYPNGGYGWGGPWQSDGALFVNEPGLTGPGHPADTTPINSPMTQGGRAWGISYFLEPQLALAQRPLASALLPGPTFSMDLDMRTVSIPQYAEGNGESAILGPGSLAYGVTVVASPTGDYMLHLLDASSTYTEYDTGLPVSDQYIHLDVTVVDNSNVHVTLESLVPDGASASVVLPDNVPITYLTLTDQGVGYLPDAELYFNNIQVTPEPAAPLILVAAIAAAILRRHRPLRRSRL